MESLLSAGESVFGDDARAVLRLLRVALERVQEHLDTDPTTGDGGSSTGHGRHSAEDGDPSAHRSCRSCPICQGADVLRRSAPEVLDTLAGLATGLAESLRAARASGEGADQRTDPGDDRGGSGDDRADPADDRTGDRTDRTTNRIDLRTRPPSTVHIDITG